MILLLDNYDSFTFNLYQYLGEMGEEIRVFRNDKISLEEIESLAPKQIVLSPGPGRPEQAGIMNDLIGRFAASIPILGICLGFQGIGQVYGGRVVHAPELFHGKTSTIKHTGTGLFKGLPREIEVGRYHSLVVERASLPDCFEVTAWTDNQLLMGIDHKRYPLSGIQFHPESILTPDGKTILKNFLEKGNN